jgi:hypothetical protein
MHAVKKPCVYFKFRFGAYRVSALDFNYSISQMCFYSFRKMSSHPKGPYQKSQRSSSDVWGEIQASPLVPCHATPRHTHPTQQHHTPPPPLELQAPKSQQRQPEPNVRTHARNPEKKPLIYLQFILILTSGKHHSEYVGHVSNMATKNRTLSCRQA